MKVLTEKEFEGLPHGEWLECADALPPVGWEVVVKTVDGKITALTRFIRYEDAPAEHGYWDNNYPGKGNLYLFKSVVSWCKLPSPDSTFSAQLATVTAQRDELIDELDTTKKALAMAVNTGPDSLLELAKKDIGYYMTEAVKTVIAQRDELLQTVKAVQTMCHGAIRVRIDGIIAKCEVQNG